MLVTKNRCALLMVVLLSVALPASAQTREPQPTPSRVEIIDAQGNLLGEAFQYGRGIDFVGFFIDVDGKLLEMWADRQKIFGSNFVLWFAQADCRGLPYVQVSGYPYDLATTTVAWYEGPAATSGVSTVYYARNNVSEQIDVWSSRVLATDGNCSNYTQPFSALALPLIEGPDLSTFQPPFTVRLAPPPPEQAPGQSRPTRVAAVDSRDRVVGIAYQDRSATDQMFTLLSFDGLVMEVSFTRESVGGIGGAGDVFFDQPDCQGSPYVQPRGRGYPGDWRILRAYTTGYYMGSTSCAKCKTIYYGLAEEVGLVTLLSRYDLQTANCESFTSPWSTEMAPLKVGPDLSPFVPPFRLELTR